MGKSRKSTGPRYPKELNEQLCKNPPFKDKMTLKEVLGSGALSTVRRAVDRKNQNRVFAAKIEQKQALASDMRRAESFAHEIEALSSLSHPNIVQWHGIQENDRDLALITELAPHGDLASAGALNPTDCSAVACQLMQALAYMHAQGFLHGDVKPENVLVVQNRPLSIRLTDFGTSARMGAVQTDSGVCCCEGEALSIKGRRGTMQYMAPEVIFQDRCSFASDIWSAALMFKGLALGRLPFETPGDYQDMLPIIHSLCAREPQSFLSQNLPMLAAVLPRALGGSNVELRAESALDLAVFCMEPSERPCAVCILARPDWLVFGAAKTEESKESMDKVAFKKMKLEITKKLRNGQDLSMREEIFCSENDL